jgi:NADH-quinone oxidoreductase subunit A
MYPWAVTFKELGGMGFIAMLLFITFVLAGLYYVIRKGALKWE